MSHASEGDSDPIAPYLDPYSFLKIYPRARCERGWGFFTVFNPPPPQASQPNPSTTSTTVTATTTESSPHSPSSTSTAILDGSPAPEKNIELIMPKTPDIIAEPAVSGSAPGTSALSGTDKDLLTVAQQSALEDPVQNPSPIAAIPSEEDQLSKPQTETMEKTAPISIPSTASLGTKTKASNPRPHRPRNQVAFEFKENPGARWLFPHESSLEFMPAEGNDPAKISASFYLPITEELRTGTTGAGPNTISGATCSPSQAATIVILQATTELWAGLQQSVSDPAATYRFMMERMKHIPPRVYVQYNLPIDFPDDQLHHTGLKKLLDSPAAPPTVQDSSKRKPDISTEPSFAAKAKRPKAVHDEKFAHGSKGNVSAKKNSASSNSSTAVLHQRQCAYCGCTSTPTWRRGPDGPHTLCNACGVKWRQGRIFIDAPPVTAPPMEVPIVPASIPTAPSPLPVPGPDALTTTAEAATRMCHGLLRSGDIDNDYTKHGVLQPNDNVIELKTLFRREPGGLRRQGSSVSTDGSSSGDVNIARTVDRDKTLPDKKRGANKVSMSVKSGPKLVPIHQIGETAKIPVKANTNLKKGKEKSKGKDKEKDKDKDKGKNRVNSKEGNDEDLSMATSFPHATSSSIAPLTKGTSPKDTPTNMSTTTSPTASPIATPSILSSPEPGKKVATDVAGKTLSTNFTATRTISKSSISAAKGSSKQKISATSSAAPTAVKPSPQPTVAVAEKLSALSAPPVNLVDDGLSLYATKNLYTNNTATFPLHFPTISIAFGPNNAYYMYPNCAVVLFENHFQIKLIHAGERTDIDVWKEGIEGTEFQIVDVGDGESMIVMKAQLRQHLSRFKKDLLNPDKNETSIVFRFRERLDGGGPPVKPLLEQWLTTEIPVAGSSEAKVKSKN
ncbi:hypothetical protein BGZ79_007958 [Entomortierella chlamydospora]|nr:hypothetical protein BGZ79_007958 [Entomortierella chlamydospora]